MLEPYRPLAFLLPAALWLTGAASAQLISSLQPGLLYYGEGEVTLNGQEIVPGPFEEMRLRPGGSIETAQGRAELLMGPEAVLRLNVDTRVELASADSGGFDLRIVRGEAQLDLLAPARKRSYAVHYGDALVEPLRRGIYHLAEGPDSTAQLVVYQGQARVLRADSPTAVGRGRALELADPASPPVRHPRRSDDYFIYWSQHRRDLLAAQRLASRPASAAGPDASVEGLLWGDREGPTPRPASGERDSLGGYLDGSDESSEADCN